MDKHIKIQGFTLLELMITLVIAGILAAVGIPSFNGLIRDSRLTAASNDLMTALNYARSEAITQNEQVIMLSKSGTDGDWKEGWDIYIDTNNNRALDPPEVLKTHEAFIHDISINTATGTQLKKSITFETDGLMKGAIGGTYYICQDNDASSARAVVINNVGRAKIVTEAVNQCSP